MIREDYRVFLTLAWIPEGTGPAGRWVLVRTVEAFNPQTGDPPSSAPSRDSRLWCSEKKSSERETDPPFSGAQAAWDHLQAGYPVREVHWVCRLKAIEGAEAVELARKLGERSGDVATHRRGRVDLALTNRMGSGTDPATVQEARLSFDERDPLAINAGTPIEEALAAAGLSGVDDPIVAHPAPPDALASTAAFTSPDTLARIHLEDTRGVQIGDDNRQINYFTIRPAPGGDGDLNALLRSADVTKAMASLEQDPGDQTLRDNLATALRGQGQSAWFARSELPWTPTVTDLPSGALDFLFSLVLIRVEGVQVGDHNVQTNRFTYLVPPPSAEYLMAEHHGLAMATVDYLFPLDDQRHDLGALAAALGTEYQSLEGSLGGRTQGITESTPLPGSSLLIRQADGVSIGDRNSQIIKYVYDIDSVKTRVAVDRSPVPILGSPPSAAGAPRSVAAPGLNLDRAPPDFDDLDLDEAAPDVAALNLELPYPRHGPRGPGDYGPSGPGMSAF